MCSGKTDSHYANWDKCRVALAEALTHVEDWSLAKLGLHHKQLNSTEVEPWDGGPPSYPEAEGGAGAEGAGGSGEGQPAPPAGPEGS